MQRLRDFKAQDLHGLARGTVTALAAQMLAHTAHIARQACQIDLKDQQIRRQTGDIAWRGSKLETINFELARLKRWKFGTKTEAMNAEQRQMFQDTPPSRTAKRWPNTCVASRSRTGTGPKTPPVARPNAVSRWRAWPRT